MDTDLNTKNTRNYEEIIQKVTLWTQTREDIYGVLVLGSRARKKRPADEWADLDFLIITKTPKFYTSTLEWIKIFGTPLLTFVETLFDGDFMERRVLYEGMLDVDFGIYPLEKFIQIIKNFHDAQMRMIRFNSFGRGIRILVDKEGGLEKLRKLIPTIKYPSAPLPTEKQYLHLVNDLLYHAVFAAKHLRRGEVWRAKMTADSYIPRKFLQMIEWHAQVTQEKGYDTWFAGKYLEKWADPRIIAQLSNVFSHYKKKDMIRSLQAFLDLFHWVAMEIAEKMGYNYPLDIEKEIKTWIIRSFQNC